MVSGLQASLLENVVLFGLHVSQWTAGSCRLRVALNRARRPAERVCPGRAGPTGRLRLHSHSPQAAAGRLTRRRGAGKCYHLSFRPQTSAPSWNPKYARWHSPRPVYSPSAGHSPRSLPAGAGRLGWDAALGTPASSGAPFIKAPTSCRVLPETPEKTCLSVWKPWPLDKTMGAPNGTVVGHPPPTSPGAPSPADG